ncbi:MAG: cytochrome c-type biogenesis protein CcmH [Actinomycetota bacterium]|nr:cytochrome c-type biogenesis protein CcmH [Actinomycetota bacterium]
MNRSVLHSTVRFAWVAIVLVVIASLAIAVTADRPALTSADRVRQLTEDFACPVCAGQSLAESDAAVARTIRATISTLVDEGADDNEVRSLLVTRFGADIEYNPSGSGVISLVWILPVVVGGVAVGLLALAVRRWQGLAPVRSVPRRPSFLIGVTVLSVLAGLLLAGTVGSRRGGSALSGDLRASTRTLLVDASVAPIAEAIGLYDQVLELQPSNVEALAYRGWAAWRGGEVDQARTDFDNAVTFDPAYPDVRVFRASQRLSEADPAAAAEDLMVLDGLAAPPVVGDLVAASRLRERVASELARLGEVVAALELLDSGLASLDVSDPGGIAAALWAHRGWILATTGDQGLAELSLVSLDEAVAADRSNPYALAYRAVVRVAILGQRETGLLDAEAFAALADQPPELRGLLVARGLLPDKEN